MKLAVRGADVRMDGDAGTTARGGGGGTTSDDDDDDDDGRRDDDDDGGRRDDDGALGARRAETRADGAQGDREAQESRPGQGAVARRATRRQGG